LWEQFQYSDVHLIKPNGQHTKWRRIRNEQTAEWIETNDGALAYFRTIQSFREPRKDSGESQWSPLFFDLDAPGWNVELPAGEKERLLESTLSDARKLIDYFAMGFDLVPKVWFSGGKGFHILVPGEVFSAEPHPQLTYHWKHVAARIQKKLELQSLDWRVYSISRMWRISNTIHHKGSDDEPGQYKIPLLPADLSKGLDHIRSLAQSPRDIQLDDEDNEDQVNPILTEQYKKAVREYTVATKVEDYDAIEAPVFVDDHPPCVAYFLKNGLGALGTKNRADMALANYCKSRNMDLREAIVFMSDWARSIPDSLTHVLNPEARVAQTTQVVNAVYSSPIYHFSCGSMRSCSIKVDCSQCGVEKESQVITIGLTDFAKAENYGRRVCIEADVVGKDFAELIMPRKVVGGCGFDTDSTKCARCKMGDYIHDDKNILERTIEFNANEHRTLSLIDVTTAGVTQRIKRLFGVEDRCFNFKYEAEMGNANVVYLSSRISGKYAETEEDTEQQTMRTRAIYLGHDIELNKGYNLYGVVWNHPRTGKAVLLVDRLEPLQSTLSTFTLEQKRLNELLVFQPTSDQTPLDKMREIHSIFNNDFIRVWGREQIIMATDLVYHSPRRINFQKTKRLKGWLDILILGDTRQGKSDVVEKMMAYYGLGIMAAGETASRTGLLYTIRMIAGEEAWVLFGLLPRANGYLVVIDEIHGMPPYDFREFTQVRSKGVVDVKRVASGTALAETRLISIANARPGKALASYAYPVQAIQDISCFQALEDVSRFDFAIGVRAGDVSDEEINMDVSTLPTVYNPYTRELCHDLVMWIWTRTPAQVNISAETERTILDLALEISQDYIPDIPLIESADVRHKLIRIACAIAGRVYSTNDGNILDVLPAHALAAREVLDEFYKADGLNYFGWSDDHKKIAHSENKLQELKNNFKASFSIQWQDIATWILDVSDFNKTLLRSACGLISSETDQVMAFMITNRFIVTDKHKYIKTPSGRMFLQDLFKDDIPIGDEIPEFDINPELEDEF